MIYQREGQKQQHASNIQNQQNATGYNYSYQQAPNTLSQQPTSLPVHEQQLQMLSQRSQEANQPTVRFQDKVTEHRYDYVSDRAYAQPMKQPSSLSEQYKALDMRKLPQGNSLKDMADKDHAGQIKNSQAQMTELEEQYRMDPALRRQRQMAGLLYQEGAERFSDLELSKFKEAFTFFDRNGDGTMSTDDVGLALRSMGALVSGKEIKLLIAKYDVDRIGRIEMQDYIAMLGEVINKPDDGGMIRSAFSAFDKDSSGMLSIDEMKHVMTRIGDTLSPEESNNFFSVLDTHGDGHIRMEDLMELLMPQTNKDAYSKAVVVNHMVDQSPQMNYGGQVQMQQQQRPVQKDY